MRCLASSSQEAFLRYTSCFSASVPLWCPNQSTANGPTSCPRLRAVSEMIIIAALLDTSEAHVLFHKRIASKTMIRHLEIRIGFHLYKRCTDVLIQYQLCLRL